MKEINLNARGKYGSSKDKAYTPQEAREIYNKIDNNKDRVIFILTAFGGLRLGELTQIRREWIQRINVTDEKTVLKIKIPEEDRDIKNKKSKWAPKTKRKRSVYIFEKELAIEVENYFYYNESLNLSYRGLQDRIKRKFKVSPHPLRATAQNYFYYHKELNKRIISQLLGHKDPRTTEKYYASINDVQTEAFLMNKLSKE